MKENNLDHVELIGEQLTIKSSSPMEVKHYETAHDHLQRSSKILKITSVDFLRVASVKIMS